MMKKRLIACLLTLLIALAAFPRLVSARAMIDQPADAETGFVTASPEDRSSGVFQTDVFSRLSRLTGPNGGETYAISAATRSAVTALIIAGLNNWDERIDVAEYELSPEDCEDCFNNVLASHHEFFYILGWQLEHTDEVAYAILPIYNTGYTKSDVSAFNSVCASVIAGMPSGTDAEKLLYLHDWLVTHCDYDVNLFVTGTSDKISAFDALVGGCAVCDGYAKAYKHLCDLAEIYCEYVSSDAINHAWNVVKVADDGIDNAYYYIDCTWDDPVNESSLVAEMTCSHQFFLICKEECMGSHASNDWVNDAGQSVYNYPTTEYFRYGNGWWKKVDRPVQWVNGCMCYAKSTDIDHVYFRDSGASTESAVTVQGGGEVWHVWGSTNYYAEKSEPHDPVSFITLASLGGAFYYSTPTQIWKITTGGSMSLAYTLTSAEKAKGYLYGIRSSGGDLVYYIGQSPDAPSVATGTLSFPPEITSVTANKTNAGMGEKITWTTVASGGSGAVRYCFYLYKDGAIIYKGKYGAANTFSYTPTETGIFSVFAFVKDGSGKIVSKMSADVTVAAPITITSVTANKTSAVSGETITWTATVTGGTAPLQYCFYIYKNGTTVYKGAYSAAKTISYTPTAAGTYTAKVFVLDNVKKRADKMSDGVTVTTTLPINITSVTSNKTSAAVGESITWTATVTGGTAPLQYCFYVYKNGTTVYKGAYGTTKTFTYTPTSAGTYTAKVFVLDGVRKKADKLSDGVTVTAPTPITIASITANTAGVAVNESITWTASANGGTGTLRYCFYVYRNGTTVYKGAYGTEKVFTYTPTATGTYTAKVFVLDSAGKKEDKLSDGVAAVDSLTLVRVTTGQSAIHTGEKITWTAESAGGTGTMRYCFYVYKDGAIVKKGTYGASNVYNYTPSETGTYAVLAFVKDSNGKINSKMSVDVVVGPPIAITDFYPDSTWVMLSSSIYWNATATGGIGTLRYCFYVYKDGVIVEKGKYWTSNFYSYIPQDEAEYTAMVFVKDNTGKIVSMMCDMPVYTYGA